MAALALHAASAAGLLQPARLGLLGRGGPVGRLQGALAVPAGFSQLSGRSRFSGANGRTRQQVVAGRVFVVEKGVVQGELAKQIQHGGIDKEDSNRYKDAIVCHLLQLLTKNSSSAAQPIGRSPCLPAPKVPLFSARLAELLKREKEGSAQALATSTYRL